MLILLYKRMIPLTRTILVVELFDIEIEFIKVI